MLTRLETNHVSDSHGSLYPNGWSRALRRFRVGLGNLEDGLHRRRGPAAQDPHGSGSLHRLVLNEIKKAKLRFDLPADTPVVSCYEAGRDGFWIHRFLAHEGIQNIVVDSASIEVSRRKRRAKSDRLDAVKLVSMLIRWHNGEKKVWSVVHVPTVADEDRRQLHRELIELKSERTELANRIKGLLAGLGLNIVVDDKLPARLEKLRQWDEARCRRP